jgi:hypothetical protein
MFDVYEWMLIVDITHQTIYFSLSLSPVKYISSIPLLLSFFFLVCYSLSHLISSHLSHVFSLILDLTDTQFQKKTNKQKKNVLVFVSLQTSKLTLVSTPLHSTPLHSIPLHSIPLHSTPHCQLPLSNVVMDIGEEDENNNNDNNEKNKQNIEYIVVLSNFNPSLLHTSLSPTLLLFLTPTPTATTTTTTTTITNYYY